MDLEGYMYMAITVRVLLITLPRFLWTRQLCCIVTPVSANSIYAHSFITNLAFRIESHLFSRKNLWKTMWFPELINFWCGSPELINFFSMNPLKPLNPPTVWGMITKPLKNKTSILSKPLISPLLQRGAVLWCCWKWCLPWFILPDLYWHQKDTVPGQTVNYLNSPHKLRPFSELVALTFTTLKVPSAVWSL